jgi:hypothetical protein
MVLKSGFFAVRKVRSRFAPRWNAIATRCWRHQCPPRATRIE